MTGSSPCRCNRRSWRECRRNVAYNRRAWGNFYYTDNRAVGPGDYDVATLTAPRHPDLPDGGGYP